MENQDNPIQGTRSERESRDLPGSVLSLWITQPTGKWGLLTFVQCILTAEREVFLPVVVELLNHVQLFATPWTVARQALLSLGFSRQEYWSGLAGPPPGDLSHPGIEPASLMSPALADGFFTTSAAWEAPIMNMQNPVLGKVSYVTSLDRTCSWKA